MTPLNNALTIEESLRVGCQMGRADAELIAPAIETLSRELTCLATRWTALSAPPSARKTK